VGVFRPLFRLLFELFEVMPGVMLFRMRLALLKLCCCNEAVGGYPVYRPVVVLLLLILLLLIFPLLSSPVPTV